MENRKIFIALNNFEKPNLLANYGIQLAKKLEKKAFLYGLATTPVVTPPVAFTSASVNSPIPSQMQTVKKVADRNLEQLSLALKQIHPNVEHKVEIGFVEESIVDKAADDVPYCVLIERVNEMSTLHEWFGTYATRLAENIDAPVLVLPQSYPWSSVNNILYVMDLNDHKVENMRFLSDTARKLDAKLTVAVVNNDATPDEQERYAFVVNTLQQLLGYTKVSFHQVFAEESAAVVEQLMETERADWLAFEHKSQSFLERVFNDYNTKRLILQSERPVLVF